MSGPDLYAVLGVPREATAAELAAAYRQRARLTHPDAGGDTLAFRAVQGAYEILRDPGLRAGYDAELNGGHSTAPKPAEPAGSGERPAPSESRASQGAGTGAPRRAAPSPPRRRLYSDLVDFGQIRWAERFVDVDIDHLEDQVKVVPGRWWWALRAASWAAVTAWCLAGVWVGATHVEPRMTRVAWTLAWWLVAAIVAWHLLRARWSVLIVAAALLAWPAYTSPGSGWSWVVYGWLAGAVALPPVRAAVIRPLWSRRRVWEGNVFGEPSWHGAATAPIACELTVIPGVRVIHQAAASEHVIVLDRRVALIGGPDATEVAGFPVRVWPSAVAADPQRAVEEIGSWLLADSDGWTVDRRTLAAVAR